MVRLMPVHPMPMRTVFRHCFLVNFAMDPQALEARLPDHLRPDLHDGRAYLSIVIAKMERMRPAFLPAAMGTTYTQVVYRTPVRCGAERGVCFLRSDADSALMVLGGNALTFFKFHRSRARWQLGEDAIRFSLRPPGDEAVIEAEYDIAGGQEAMPSASRFATLNQAEAFLTDRYMAFSMHTNNGKVDAVRIRRNEWQSVVVEDRIGTYGAMEPGVLFESPEARLDSIFYVKAMDYYWHRGRKLAVR